MFGHFVSSHRHSKPAIHSWLCIDAEAHERPLQGTLDLLILKILARSGPLYGYALAQRIHQIRDDSLRIEEGSLYTTLQRMAHEKSLRLGIPRLRVAFRGN